VAAVSLVENEPFDDVADQRFHLRDHRRQRMAVIGIAGECLQMSDELATPGMADRGRNRDLCKERGLNSSVPGKSNQPNLVSKISRALKRFGIVHGRRSKHLQNFKQGHAAHYKD
jgi:hypothetical protein